MPSLFTEDTYEQAVIELFENMGYDHLYAPEMERVMFGKGYALSRMGMESLNSTRTGE